MKQFFRLRVPRKAFHAVSAGQEYDIEVLTPGAVTLEADTGARQDVKVTGVRLSVRGLVFTVKKSS